MHDFDYDGLADNRRWYQDQFPSEGKKILYLDADYIAYTVGFCSKPEDYEAYLNGNFDLKDKLNHACFLIRDAMVKAKADAVWLFVTDSKTNFRVNLVDSYKAQRETEKPPFWDEVKAWVGSRDCVVNSIRNEADDMISIKASEYYKTLDEEGVARERRAYEMWSTIIIGSKDKDVDHVYGLHVDLNTGEHYFVTEEGCLSPKWATKEVNHYAHWRLVNGEPVPESYMGVVDIFSRGKNKGQPKLKRVLVGKAEKEYIKALKGTGAKFFYAQMLMGDRVDNYFGIDGCGATGAYEALNDLTTIEEFHDKVVSMYKEAYGEKWEEPFLLNGRMAFMQKYVDQLWDGKSW